MKNFIACTALCVAVAACQPGLMPSKTPFANTEIVRHDSTKMLLGRCSASMLQQPPYHSWFSANYNAYQPNAATTERLVPAVKHMRMEIFLGTWCGDSKREVPRMLKLLQNVGVDSNAISLIFVDNASTAYKQSPQHEEQGKSIFKVPTFLVYNKRKLVGRIVESPVVSLEADLLSILNGEAYTPNYKAVDFWIKKDSQSDQLLTSNELETLANQTRALVKNAGEFNAYGYILLSAKQFTEAQNVFTLNTLLYPNDANVWDSLAELYTTISDNENAQRCYAKVAELKASQIKK